VNAPGRQASTAAHAGTRDTNRRQQRRRRRPAGPGQHRRARAGHSRPRRLLRDRAGIALTAVLLAAVPWGLTRLAGRDTVITVLAGAAWLLWAVFTATVAIEIIALVRGQPAPRLPALGPVQALAATLAGAAVLAAAHPTRPAPPTADPGQAVLAAATAGPPRPRATGPAIHRHTPVRARLYRVAAGDDLWGIAERFLGRGEDWPQIYRINQGRPEPGGQTLTDPARILPGWTLLIPLPCTAPHPAAEHPARPQPSPHRTGSTAAPAPHPSRSVPSPGQATPGTSPRPVAVRLPSGAIAGIAVAVMVAMALSLAAVQRRRRYRPHPRIAGGLPPASPPLPGVVATLRRAGLAATGPSPGEEPATGPGPDPGQPTWQPGRPSAGSDGIPLGIGRDGSPATASLTRLGGLGLAGAGAATAARGILASLLAQTPPGHAGLRATIIIPAADAARLLPGTDPATVPGLSVPASLDDALDDMEALLLTAARDRDETGPRDTEGGRPGVTLIAAPRTPRTARRLAGILESGRDLDAAAVLLGPWPTGTTCQVTSDGTITAVTPAAPDLEQVRLFTLGLTDTAAITSVLRQAAGDPPSKNPDPAVSISSPAPDTPAAPGDPDPAGPSSGPGSSSAGSPADGASLAGAGRLVQVDLLGELRITTGGQEISGGLRKARELLAFLAVHELDGVTGEAISEALWPGSGPDQAARQRNLALRKAREMLRTATGLPAPMWITQASGRYRLDPALIGTDLQAFTSALDQARHASGDARLAACRAAVGLYRGELGGSAGWEWAEPYAETARRRALDAWTAIADLLQPTDPSGALSALEAALTHDPYNEYLYVRIMRLQAAAGHPEAVRRTLALLESRLTGLGLTPAAQTRQAAAELLAGLGPGPRAT
jgi:DNA-binding SARP family transcriptional activator